MSATHIVHNVVDALTGYNLYRTDPVLSAALIAAGGADYAAACDRFGARVGSEEVIQWGFLADQSPPRLHTHDRQGRRRDEVAFHPAWDGLMGLSIAEGLHALPWEPGAGQGAQAGRAALFYLMAQNELGHCCPISMTFSVVPVLRRWPEVGRPWLARISRRYDGRVVAPDQKSGVTFGMAMTEKQGGSDVAANRTVAVSAGDTPEGACYRITGHKFFCSAPNSDAFCVLAQVGEAGRSGGLTCFLVPRFLPDGTKNNLFFQRIKDKLGNRSNASSEVEYADALGWRLGPEGRGVATIIEMVNHTRLDCTIGAAALMRAALVQALHHARHRSAFGRRLCDQPLMQNVLADLSMESEAATLLMLRLAGAFDRAGQGGAAGAQEDAFRRIATPIAKYWLCKRVVPQVAEALECLGGGGFVEESVMPRLYRESPLYSIWEGSGNVICLDVLRAMARSPESLAALRAEIGGVAGESAALDAFAAQTFGRLQALTAAGDTPDGRDRLAFEARWLVERLALCQQGSLLLRHAPGEVAGCWIAARIGGAGGRLFGSLTGEVPAARLLERAFAG